jgi:hypothetical protein
LSSQCAGKQFEMYGQIDPKMAGQAGRGLLTAANHAFANCVASSTVPREPRTASLVSFWKYLQRMSVTLGGKLTNWLPPVPGRAALCCNLFVS